MGRGLVMGSGAVFLAGGAAVLGFSLTRSPDPPSADQRAASGLAAGLSTAIRAASAELEPHRCARFDDWQPSQATREIGGRTWRFHDATLRTDSDDDAKLTLGVIADARGIPMHLPKLRKQFERRGVTLVVSLGGLGRTRAELEAALGALAAPDRWPVIAMPGDRESIPEHRAAIRALAGAGVIDGSRIRHIAAGEIALATFPGAPHATRLLAGMEGCVHTADDAGALTTRLGDARVRVLLSHVPPRQRGPDASDVSYSGIHIGEQFLADAIDRAGIQVAIHGLIAQARQPDRGERTWTDDPLILSAGAADGVADLTRAGPAGPIGLVVTVDQTGVNWQAVEKSTQ